MKTSEVVYGGIWTASAIAVAGYTWSALTGEYEKFPTMGGGGSQIPPAVQASDTAIGVPKLAQGKSGVMRIAGVAASPITPATTGTQGITNTIAGWVKSGIQAILP